MSVAALHPTLDAWGVDLPANLRGWKAAGADPKRVVAGSALHLPFESAWFDFAWSLGVLEHIGETAPPSERRSRSFPLLACDAAGRAARRPSGHRRSAQMVSS